MSERGDALLYRVIGPLMEDGPEDIACSVCEHLGITWEHVDELFRASQRFEAAVTGYENLEAGDARKALATSDAGSALATLLEAAGIER